MYKKNKLFYVEESEDSAILYNSENDEKLFVLNEIGNLIFQNLEKFELYEIKKMIMMKYDISENELNNDVDNFINNLEALHVIEKC